MKCSIQQGLLRGSVCALALLVCSVGHAQTARERPPGSPLPGFAERDTRPGQPTAAAIAPPAIEPAILTMVTLGNAGLLQSAFSIERESNTITRVGESRASFGYAGATGIRTGYRYDDQALILPVSFIKSVPLGDAGVGFFRLATAGILADSGRQLQRNDGNVERVDAQFIYAPIPSRFFALGLVYHELNINNYLVGASRGISDRSGIGGRFDYVEKVTDHFGVTMRAQITDGRDDIQVARAGYRHRPNETQYYLQSELVGTYRNVDSSLIPEGWILHPTVGANFFYGQFQKTADSFGFVSGSVFGPNEQYGVVWGDLRLEKAAKFTADAQFLPFVTVGLEREYRNNVDVLTKEPNFGRVSAGFTVTAFGQRLDLAYTYRPGFTGRRTSQDLVIATSVNF